MLVEEHFDRKWKLATIIFSFHSFDALGFKAKFVPFQVIKVSLVLSVGQKRSVSLSIIFSFLVISSVKF